MPRETHKIIEVCFKKEDGQKKEQWRIARWMTAHIINISQKYVKHPIREEQLFRFLDEIKREEIDPEERKKTMMENLKFFKKKFWTKIKGSSLDDIKIFDEDDYERLKNKLKGKN